MEFLEENIFLKKIVIEILVSLCTFAGSFEFFELFSKAKKELIVTVLMPLCLISSNAIEETQENPESSI